MNDIEFWKEMELRVRRGVDQGSFEPMFIESAKQLADLCRRKAAAEVAKKLSGEPESAGAWKEQR